MTTISKYRYRFVSFESDPYLFELAESLEYQSFLSVGFAHQSSIGRDNFYDAWRDKSLHFVALSHDGKIVATLRLIVGSWDEFTIAQMALRGNPPSGLLWEFAALSTNPDCDDRAPAFHLVALATQASIADPAVQGIVASLSERFENSLVSRFGEELFQLIGPRQEFGGSYFVPMFASRKHVDAALSQNLQVQEVVEAVHPETVEQAHLLRRPDPSATLRPGATAPSTKTRILAAGVSLLLSRDQPKIEQVRLKETVESIGLTTGAAYGQFENQADFRRELALHLAQDFTWANTSETLVGDFAELLERDPSVEDLILEAGEQYFEHFVRRPDFYVALQLWVDKSPSQELRSAIRRGYKEVGEDSRSYIELILELSGRRLREPFTANDAAVAMSALAEGFALRYKFDEPAVLKEDGTHLFAQLLLSLVDNWTEPA